MSKRQELKRIKREFDFRTREVKWKSNGTRDFLMLLNLADNDYMGKSKAINYSYRLGYLEGKKVPTVRDRQINTLQADYEDAYNRVKGLQRVYAVLRAYVSQNAPEKANTEKELEEFGAMLDSLVDYMENSYAMSEEVTA